MLCCSITLPRQGFATENNVLRWRSCGAHGELTMLAKSAHVEGLTAGPLWPPTNQKDNCPLLRCRASFRKEMATGREVVVAVGHTHRETAIRNFVAR